MAAYENLKCSVCLTGIALRVVKEKGFCKDPICTAAAFDAATEDQKARNNFYSIKEYSNNVLKGVGKGKRSRLPDKSLHSDAVFYKRAR